MRVERWQHLLRFIDASTFLDEIVVLAVAVERRFAHHAATFDAPMFLCTRERIFLSNFRHSHAVDVLSVRDDEMRVDRRAQKISVESRLIGNRSSFFASVTKGNRNR